MSTGGNIFDPDRMRIEIAILQDDLDAKKAGWARFKIPVIMTEDRVARFMTNNSNIVNKRNANLARAYIDIENTTELYVPQEFTYFAGVDVIPRGTRFLVCFVGGNVNDAKIIGRYDYDLGGES